MLRDRSPEQRERIGRIVESALPRKAG